MRENNYPQLKTINLMSSNICNGYCKCCQYRSIYKDNFKPMDDKLWKKICVELFNFKYYQDFHFLKGTEDIKLYDLAFHFGFLDEPLLDPYLIERIKDLKKIGYNKIGIVTNCSLLTQNRLKELCETGVNEFYLSLLSTDKVEYEELTGLNYNQVMANIYNAITYLSNKDVRLVINAPLDSWSDKDKFNNIFTQDIIDKYVFFNIKDNRNPEYKAETIEWNDSCFRMMPVKGGCNGCDTGISRMAVLHTGDVLMCNLDLLGTPIGNIAEDGFGALIEKQLKMVLNRGVVEPECCKNCYKC